MKYVLSLCILTALVAFSNTSIRDSYTVNRVKKDYSSSINQFTTQLDHFISIVSHDTDRELIQKAHLETRKAYKSFEYLITHFDNQIVKQYLNGAPLPVAKFENGKTKVLEPIGLQVIDELVFSDQIEKADIKHQLLIMREAIDDIRTYESSRYIDERHILLAMREQLIRIISLGLSGFDTPGSLNALEEAEVSLLSMQQSFKYFSTFVDDDNDLIFKEVLSAFDACLSMLQASSDFESFDRVDFIRNKMNPLSALLLVFHDLSGIQFNNKENAVEQGLNQKAMHLFADNLLNADAYSGMLSDQDNTALKTLGASLFYDETLSIDNSMSCATCHNPAQAFTDGKQLSISNHREEATKRNTPSLINSVYSKRFFYDLRAHKLDEQIIEVFANPNEFHADFEEISKRLQTSPGYISMFDEAYPTISDPQQLINRNRIITAIISYVKSLSSFESEFDKYMRQDIDVIDPSVKQGFNLFMGKAACGTCHFAPLFNGLVPPDFDENETEILGVPIKAEKPILDDDEGRIDNGWKHEQADHYRYSFKTVSIRNIDKTAPYMHNGIYETLEEVLDFYNRGGGAGMGIDVPHQTLAADSLHLSKLEMGQIIDFMKSLSDTEFDVMIPDTLPRYRNSEGQLPDVRKNQYATEYNVGSAKH